MKKSNMVEKLLESLYRSNFGRMMSALARALAVIKRPYMIYGYYDYCSSKFHKYTRLSDSVVILNRNKLSIDEYVWVWHYSILDATEGLTIEEGCQIGAWVGIFTHGSQTSIRLYGKEYVNVPSDKRIGYTRGAVRIGAYSFIGAGSIILPGVTIGKGCIIGVGALVNKDVPDYSIVVGNPAKVVSSTKKLDKPFLDNKFIRENYYDNDVPPEILKKKNT